MRYLSCSLLFVLLSLQRIPMAAAQVVPAPTFAPEVLHDALEGGSSLIIVKILSPDALNQDAKIKIALKHPVQLVQVVIEGDVKFSALQAPFDLYVGSGDDVPKAGSLCAVFVIKPGLRILQSDRKFIEIAPGDRQSLREITRSAQNSYRRSDIRRFRRAKLQPKPDLPPLSPTILEACHQIKTQPGNCAAAALVIYRSPLGSRMRPTFFGSSMLEDLPPDVPLTRSQIVFLLGEPTYQIGRSYTWFCGETKYAQRGKKEETIFHRFLTVDFAPDEQTKSLTVGDTEEAYW